MNKALLYILIVLIPILIAGCTPAQQDKARELLGQHRCAAYNGYLCSAPDDCGVSYLDTIESYCCPIKCQTCNQSCDDGNQCTRDYCSKSTNYSCKYEELKPCPNDGICEEGEYMGSDTSCPTSGYMSGGEGIRAGDLIESNDCPESCDDGNFNTADSYDFEAQGCKHKECESSVVSPQEDVICPRFDTNWPNCTSNGTYVWNVTALDPDETEINTTPAIVVNETELYIRRNNITSNPEELLPHLSSDYSTIVYPIEDIILDSTGFISGKSILSHHLPILYNRYTIYKFRTIYDADLWRNTTCEQTRQILLERYYDINHNPGPLLLGHYEYGCFSNRYGFYSETGEISHLYISTRGNIGFIVSLNGTSNEEIFGGHIRAMLDIIERAPTEIS